MAQAREIDQDRMSFPRDDGDDDVLLRQTTEVMPVKKEEGGHPMSGNDEEYDETDG